MPHGTAKVLEHNGWLPAPSWHIVVWDMTCTLRLFCAQCSHRSELSKSSTASAVPGSVINQFNLDRLSGFEWAQKQAVMDQLTACSEANATECVVDQQAEGVRVRHFPLHLYRSTTLTSGNGHRPKHVMTGVMDVA